MKKSVLATSLIRIYHFSNHPPFIIQPVEPVIGLTEEEQRQREEDPNLTIYGLLGLPLCEGYITTPLQMLDGQYVNQPSHFLPLAQEAQKLAKKFR